MRDQLTHKAFVVLERDDAFFVVASDRLREVDSFLDKPFDPEPDGAGKDREGCDGNLPAALSAAPCIGPGKESKNATRGPRFVAEVKMVGRRIVEIHGALDQSQAKDAGVEIEIALRVAGDAGYVMNAGGLETHRDDFAKSWPSAMSSGRRSAPFMRLALIGTGFW